MVPPELLQVMEEETVDAKVGEAAVLAVTVVKAEMVPRWGPALKFPRKPTLVELEVATGRAVMEMEAEGLASWVKGQLPLPRDKGVLEEQMGLLAPAVREGFMVAGREEMPALAPVRERV